MFGLGGRRPTSAAAPVITSISPNHGTQAGGTPVTLSGHGFTGATFAAVAGVNLTSFVVVNDTTITGVTAFHSPPGSGLDVTTSGGGLLAGGWTYDAVSTPTVTAISPTHGTQLGGTFVTITGTNFLTAFKAGIDNGGLLDSFAVIDDMHVSGFTKPGSPAGPADVAVTNLAGTGILSLGFTYDAEPILLWRLDEMAAPYANQGTGGISALKISFGAGSYTAHSAGPGGGFAGDFNPGTGGAALAVDGRDSLSSDSDVVPPGNSFSYSCWIYLRSGGTGNTIILSRSYGDSWPYSGNFGNGIVLPGHGTTWQPGFYLVGGGVVYTNSVGFIPLNTWTHLAATFDGTTLSLYMNGVLDTTATAPSAPRVVDYNLSANGIWMSGGNAVLHGNDLFDGRLYKLRIDPVCLSAAQVLFLASDPTH